jgi:hypothetical protein
MNPNSGQQAGANGRKAESYIEHVLIQEGLMCVGDCQSNTKTYMKNYSYKSVLGKNGKNGRIEFYIPFLNLLIESKSQNVPGSKDECLTYFVENIRKGCFPGVKRFAIILDGKAFTNNHFSYIESVKDELCLIMQIDLYKGYDEFYRMLCAFKFSAINSNLCYNI